MKQLLYVTVCTAWMAASQAFAQDSTALQPAPAYAQKQHRFTFAVQPTQWFNNGFRFDFETRLGNGPAWLQFGHAVYFIRESDDRESDYEYNNYYYDDYQYDSWFYGRRIQKMIGGGLDVNYKRFINRQRSLYFAGGVQYMHFNISYPGRAWRSYTEDGLEFHEYAPASITQRINRIGLNTFFGWQGKTGSAFLFDMYIGIAARHSFADSSKRLFDTSMISYGYSGPVFLTGVRLGFGVK